MDYKAEIERLNAIIAKQGELIALLSGNSPLGSSERAAAEPDVSVMKLTEGAHCLAGFEKYLRNKALSENTIETYATGMKKFFEKFDDVNSDTVREYNDALIRGSKPKSANNRLAGLTHWFEYTGKSFPIRRVREEAKYFRDDIINDEQYERLTSWARSNSRNTYIICRVLARTGMRVSELISIKKADFLNGEAHIVSKANHARPIYFTRELIEDITPFLDPESEYLLAHHYTHSAIKTRSVSEALKRAAEKTGIDPAVVYPHSFRHYFAKKFLERNNDLSLLADILGHNNVQTTAIYTRKTKAEQVRLLNEAVNW